MLHSSSLLKVLGISSLCMLFSCNNGKRTCEDQHDPVVYFTSTSMTTNRDTSVIQAVGMLANDKYAILSNVDTRKINIAPFTNQMYLFFSQYQNGVRVTDTVSITYERGRQYTGSECGFIITAEHITIADKHLHVAKQAFIHPSNPQQIQLVY